jgi:hypothetical protein
MKIEHITAISVLGFALAVARPCTAASSASVVTLAPQTAPVTTPPVAQVPPGYVWNGSEYVGQTGSKYYYVGPPNTWVVLDPTHQPGESQTNNPNGQSQEIRNTRYQGHDEGQSQLQSPPNSQSQENPQMPEHP